MLLVKYTETDGRGKFLGSYVLNHDDDQHRRTLGERCRVAFESGHCVSTTPLVGNSEKVLAPSPAQE